MLRFGNGHDIIISQLLETKNSSKYLVGYLDHVIRPLILILPKTNAYMHIC